MGKAREWVKQFMSQPSDLPVSFMLDGTTNLGIPKNWKTVSNKHYTDSNTIETVFEGTDTRTGLTIRIECTEYQDFPVVEWVGWFTNHGHKPTPIINDILAIDGAFNGSSPVLYHCKGDFFSEEGYTPHETPLPPGNMLRLAPNDGRPCDGEFPYYRVMFEDFGMSMAVGWPAQWSANFEGLANGIHIRAGQEKTNLRLMPSESIRTPKMTILFWTGGVSRAVNLWRRWYLAHIMPRPNDEPMKPLLSCECPDDGVEFTAATEENQIRHIEKAKQRGIPFDVWWIDAGWYSCYNEKHEREWWVTGTWEPDPERFPNGLKPVSDHAAQNGADLLVWFEPERVQPGTKLDKERSEWLLKTKDSDAGLLNLGNPECRQWLTDHVCKLIQNNGIKIYRQDHNFPPLEHWRSNEAQDRQGLNENLHVQGYLQFWDDLLERNPGLWIDSCASGGRRNDLETMRRAVPLHYTDFGYGDHPVKLAFHHTMYAWIPYFKESALSWDIDGKARFAHVVDSYSYHCSMAPMFSTAMDIRRDDYDYVLANKLINLWRRASSLLLYGDYYPLTPFHRSAEKWVVWQFDSPTTGCGLVQGIRLPKSREDSITIYPAAIQPHATYWFENPELGEQKEILGEILINDGFTFTLPKRTGAIWFYRRK